MSLYRTNAIVLRSRNFGEADRVLVLLSEEFGKFEAVVKGARRQRSRFVGSTLPFNCIKTLLFTGKSLDTLSQAEIVHSFSKLHEDLTKLAYATFWTELVDGFVPERAEAKGIFRFLLAAFIVLETTLNPERLNLAFEIRLLNYLGYQPQLDHCSGCGEASGIVSGFSAEAGGVVCRSCAHQFRDLIAITISVPGAIHKLAETDLRELDSLDLAKDELQIIQKVLRVFIEARLEKPLKSQLFLDNVLS
jgi:DNA repair protein RecO (recombination protein O)